MTAREVLTETPPRCRNPKCREVRAKRRGKGGYEGARGFCVRCYGRWRIAGFPVTGPPEPMTHAERAAITNTERQEACEDRMAEFASYRRQGCTVEMAARYVGVSADTGYRYAAELKRRQREEVIAA